MAPSAPWSMAATAQTDLNWDYQTENLASKVWQRDMLHGNHTP
jgi:hypothetical protein